MKKYFILILLSVVFVSAPVYAGTLSCTVTTASSCTSGTDTIIYRMSSSSNAHAELPSQSNTHYDSTVVCCSGPVGLSSSCSTGVHGVVLRLSGNTNAHGEENNQSNSNYNSHDACLSVPTGGNISIGYGTDCTGYDTTIGSLSSTTNAHIGDPGSYPLKICGTASNPPVSGTLTSAVFDTGIHNGSVGYNSIMWKGTLGGLGLNEGKVRFRFSAEANSTGDNTGTWNYYGVSCNPSPSAWFETSGPNQPTQLPNCYWNNKEFFRYIVQICSNSTCDTSLPGVYPSPVVNDIIVNWSP